MMASGPCNDGSVFPHSAQDVLNLVIDGDYMLKKKKDIISKCVSLTAPD